MTDLVAPGNDHRHLLSMPIGDELNVSVVIPIYNRVELLDNVLAGLSAQDIDDAFDVIVVDDGSEEDVSEICDRWSDMLDIQYLRQERKGRGVGRARNLGAEAARGGLLVFLDADCIPSPDLLAGHLGWHHRAENLVVSASRRHIDRSVDAKEVTSEWASLPGATGAEGDEPINTTVPDDWRRVFYRRSQGLLLGDDAYRAVLGGLMSVRRSRFIEVGGFDTSFQTWGGEDTELGWRLWNSGCFVVPADDIVVVHQRHLDIEGGSEGRRRSRDRILSLMADKVPQHFYRKAPSHLFTIPKVTWIVYTADERERSHAWKMASEAMFQDSELVIIAPGETAEGDLAYRGDAGRMATVGDFGAAVMKARGEVLAMVDGRARIDRRLLARAMRRYDDSRTGVVRVGYKSSRDRLLRLSDLDRVDSSAGRDGLPFFGLVRRRELMKDRVALADPERAWTTALDRSRVELLVTDLVEVPADAVAEASGKLPGFREARSAGATELARGVKRAVRPEKAEAPDEEQPTRQDLPGIEYVGLAGHNNLGDDAILVAIRQLMPWAEVGVDVQNPRAVMLGGGTLFNAGGYYLNKVRRVDGPRLERVVFGTGVRSVEFWDETENVDDWDPFLRSALGVGVRGPLSMDQMRSWGYKGPAQVIGDPALTLRRPDGIEDVDGRVVICPVFTGGECWGGDDNPVFDAFAHSIAHLESEGREVVIMTAHPNDDRWAIEIMRMAGLDGLPYIPAYEDLDGSLRLIASSDLVIGERLHAVVLAAAVGTPFVAVEYRPKLRDFALSVGNEDSLVRTDAMGNLDRVIRTVLADGTGRAEATSEMVESFRLEQQAVSELLRSELLP
jgi:GT2 family glycosyltransferase